MSIERKIIIYIFYIHVPVPNGQLKDPTQGTDSLKTTHACIKRTPVPTGSSCGVRVLCVVCVRVLR